MNHSQKKWSGKSVAPSALDRLPGEEAAREPQHSREAERHVIACCMIEGSDALAKCIAARLTPRAFYFAPHAAMFEVMLQLRAEGRVPALETVAQVFMDHGKLDSIGGMEGLMEIVREVPTTAHAAFMIETVKAKWILRDLVRDCADAMERSYGYTGDLEELLAPLAMRFNRAVEYVRAGTESMETKVAAGYERTIAKIEGRQDVTRQLVTGLPEFNRRFGAFDVREEDYLIAIAGATSVGKSALMRAFTDDFLTLKQPSGEEKCGMVFLLETTIAKYLELMAARKVRWNSRELGRMPNDVRAKYLEEYEARRALVGRRLFLFEDMVKVETLIARVEDHLREHGERSLDFVVGDHLHELYSARDFRGNREAELGYIVKLLKQTAKRLDLPFFLPTQLNRSPAKDGTVRRPTKNDLRGSGELENAFDRIELLHLPSTDMRGAEQTDNQARVMIELIQAKSRNGPIGHREFWFDRPCGDYVDIKDNEFAKRPGTPGGVKTSGGYGRS